MNRATASSPLPRSLDPLPEESLMGYLIRLAHRLSVPPSHLARLTGLCSGPRSSPGSKLLLELPKDAIEAFAQSTRLSTAEITTLTLSSWSSRYLAILRSANARTRSSWTDAWLFTGAPRFCPQCLAGDGSVIQQRHAGPWKKSWHLPVVFACLQHQRFLEHCCPGCGQPGSGSSQLIPRSSDHTLHPAQCRWPASGPRAHGHKTRACGHRLDRVAVGTSPRPRPGPAVLDLQQHLLDMLSLSRPAGEAARYFTDLQLTVSLITHSWPHGRHLADTDLAGHVTAHLPAQTAHLAAGHTDAGPCRVINVPPRDSAACAGVLQAAHTVLAAPDLPCALARLVDAAAFAQRPTRTPWARVFARHQDTCSEMMRAAAEPLIRSFRRTSGPRSSRAPLRHDYRPEHIPAYLEPQWYERHLAHMTGIAPKVLRRTAAVRLVQWVMGGSMRNAATFLGINPSNTQFSSGSDVQRWTRSQHDPAEFVTALHHLAHELRSAPGLIDYQRRRDVLRSWSLDLSTWEDLTSKLPPVPGHVRPVLDDRKRQDASIFVWTHVTRGEHLFAPRPIEAGQPPLIQQEWMERRNTTWYQLSRPDPLRHYAALRSALTQYAAQLARDIDAGDPLAP
jgi:TniQ